MPSFGQLLFEARTRAGLSLAELARRCQVSTGRLSQLENSRVVAPPPEAAWRIAAAVSDEGPLRDALTAAAAAERRSACIVFNHHLPAHVRELAAWLRDRAADLQPEQTTRLRQLGEEVLANNA
jgi:transcriptional regulator with XRE-family HTH domain